MTLQFQKAGTPQGGTFPGTVIQGNGTSLQTNSTVGGTWAYTGSGWNPRRSRSACRSRTAKSNDYNITGRGLGPQQLDAAGAATHGRVAAPDVRNRAYYLQEEAQLLNEKLYLSAAVRGERSSVNGDRNKIFTFPRVAASYRWVDPKYVPFTDELKFRANYGQSGNQPNYGDRDLTIASYGLIGGLAGFGVPASVGNANIEPERLAENEYGIDASFLKERMHLEVTYFKRDITNLLVRPAPPSTGITQTVVNGGVMQSKGWEIGTTFSLIQKSDASWLAHVNWTQNAARITQFPAGVLPFTIGAAGGFGNAYGRLRFAPGFSASQIYGNVKNADGTTTLGGPIADANPTYLMTFSNEWT